MPFVQGNCPNCGGTLAVDNEKDAWVCPYCNTPFIVEKAINNYNISNTINASTVNIYGGIEKDFKIVAGTLKEYNGESTNVVIPDNVTCISYSAFHETNITSIKLPDGIKEVYLSSCRKLSEINIPSSVINLGLMNCSELKTVNLNEGLQFVYFEGCSSLDNIKLPNTIRKIKHGTFHNCYSLKNLYLPDSITQIDDDFSGCNSMEEIFLPQNISRIKLSSMKNLKRFIVPQNTKYIEINGLDSLQKIAFKSQDTIIKGLKGTEELIYNSHGFNSALLFNTNISLPYNKGTIELCLALCNKCTICGGDFNIFGTCKKCNRKRNYNVIKDVCPKCYSPSRIVNDYRQCSKCGLKFSFLKSKNAFVFSK